jgi:hypothetical protein
MPTYNYIHLFIAAIFNTVWVKQVNSRHKWRALLNFTFVAALTTKQQSQLLLYIVIVLYKFKYVDMWTIGTILSHSMLAAIVTYT